MWPFMWRRTPWCIHLYRIVSNEWLATYGGYLQNSKWKGRFFLPCLQETIEKFPQLWLFWLFWLRKWINKNISLSMTGFSFSDNWGDTCYSNILGFSFVWWGFWPRNSCSRPWPWRTEWRAWERLNFNGFPIAMISFEWELLFAENQVDLLQRL